MLRDLTTSGFQVNNKVLSKEYKKLLWNKAVLYNRIGNFILYSITEESFDYQKFSVFLLYKDYGKAIKSLEEAHEFVFEIKQKAHTKINNALQEDIEDYDPSYYKDNILMHYLGSKETLLVIKQLIKLVKKNKETNDKYLGGLNESKG